MNANELINKINNLNKSMYIDEYDAYAVNTSNMRGVAIIVDSNTVINESFNQVQIKDFLFSINGKEENVVFLYTKNKEMSEKYGLLCLDFLDKKNRKVIEHNPLKWFSEWRDLLGDSKKKKMVYDVVGEMKVLLELRKKKDYPIWNSATAGTYDITSNSGVYEVKTTKSKTEDNITIHSQFQLEIKHINKPLFIAYVRLEENKAGYSIDTLYNDLIKEGFDQNILDTYLDEMHYQKGKFERYLKFIIHEIRLYPIDESFPKITNDSFKNNKIPDGIVNYQYTVSLNGLKYLKFD